MVSGGGRVACPTGSSGNRFGPEGGPAVGAGLEGLTGLVHLDLGYVAPPPRVLARQWACVGSCECAWPARSFCPRVCVSHNELCAV